MEQLASYALETISATGVKRYILGIYIRDTKLQMWYFDRCPGLGSDTIDFGASDEGFATFIDLILAIGQGSPENLGFEPVLKRSADGADHWSPNPEGALVRIPDGPMFRLCGETKINPTRGLIGRGTAVFDAQMQLDNGRFSEASYIVKLSWQDPSRIPEAELLKEAEGIPGIPSIIASAILGRLSGGARGKLAQPVFFTNTNRR